MLAITCVFLSNLPAFSMNEDSDPNHHTKTAVGAYSTSSSSSSDHSSSVVASKSLKENLLENGVIVRVWSGVLHGGESVGHVSLETANDYISFWPNIEHSSGFMPSLQDDLNAEQDRNPENTIFLRHQNPVALEGVHKDFEFLKWLLAKGKLRWNISGEVQSLKHSFTQKSYEDGLLILSNPTTSEDEKRILGIYETWSFNCASLVLNLLKNNKYINETESSMLSLHHAFNTAVTPDRVAAICAGKFLHSLHADADAFVIYQRLANQMKKKGIENFLSSHVHYFGLYYLKSEGDNVSQNTRLEDDVADIIRREAEDHVSVSLIRAMDSMGISDLLAHILGPDQVNSILRSTKK